MHRCSPREGMHSPDLESKPGSHIAAYAKRPSGLLSHGYPAAGPKCAEWGCRAAPASQARRPRPRRPGYALRQGRSPGECERCPKGRGPGPQRPGDGGRGAGDEQCSSWAAQACIKKIGDWPRCELQRLTLAHCTTFFSPHRLRNQAASRHLRWCPPCWPGGPAQRDCQRPDTPSSPE